MTNKFDIEYMAMAKRAANHSRCKKKQLGAVLVSREAANRGTGWKILGWNGPPSLLKECDTCPRLENGGIQSLYKCRAVHAERACLLTAASLGISTNYSALYSYMGVPCKDCLLELIAAGIIDIICIKDDLYDELSGEILKEWIEAGGKFRVINPETGKELPNKFTNDR